MTNDIYLQHASIDEEDARVLRAIVETHAVKTVLEFGPGQSTGLFLSLGCEVTSFEHDPTFVLEAQKLYPAANVFGYENVEFLDLPLGQTYFDLAFVDGPPAHPPHHPPAFARWNSMRVATHHASLIVLHDAFREREQAILGELVGQGAQVTMHPTMRGLAEVHWPQSH